MRKIPKFKSDQEAAQFWDTHSLIEFEDNLELVKEKVFVKPEKQVMTIRVDKKLANAMKAIAREKGINYSTLARMWLIERVKKEIEEINKVSSTLFQLKKHYKLSSTLAGGCTNERASHAPRLKCYLCIAVLSINQATVDFDSCCIC